MSESRAAVALGESSIRHECPSLVRIVHSTSSTADTLIPQRGLCHQSSNSLTPAMVFDSSHLAFIVVVGVSVSWKKYREEKSKDDASPEVCRFRGMMASGELTHPFLRAEYFQQNDRATTIREEDCVSNFTDLASALASCCGCGSSTDSSRSGTSKSLVEDIGQRTQHVLVILCDGMGNAILDEHLPESSFLRSNNQSDRLRAVWPSTTPAALTSLATGKWPGQHGVPGWDLREQPGCDYPGEASGGSIVQLRILAPRVMNVRNNEPANYSSLDDVFLVPPWTRTISRTKTPETRRRMMYINAYNGDDFPSWYQGETEKPSSASDFSSWQTGQTSSEEGEQPLLDVATIGETAFSTLGEPEGSQAALRYFNDGIDKALNSIAHAEEKGQCTYTYLYTAHPDKHMHTLGIDHPEVAALVRGINDEIERMWNLLGNRSKLLSMHGVETDETEFSCDVAVVVTADHGHVNVFPHDMIVLPDTIIECLEYANIGVHGKVRGG